jgi:hypothetical protein
MFLRRSAYKSLLNLYENVCYVSVPIDQVPLCGAIDMRSRESAVLSSKVRRQPHVSYIKHYPT